MAFEFFCILQYTVSNSKDSFAVLYKESKNPQKWGKRIIVAFVQIIFSKSVDMLARQCESFCLKINRTGEIPGLSSVFL